MVTKRCKVSRLNETRYHDVPHLGARVGAYVEIRETDPHPQLQRIFWQIDEVEEEVKELENNSDA